MKQLLFLFLGMLCLYACAQQKRELTWWNPAQSQIPVVEGKVKDVQEAYHRFPKNAEQSVREAVWNLSKHSAGLMIRFRSNAEEIHIRYGTTQQQFEMDHMPATSVSGLDLYAVDSEGQGHWCAARRQFGDTIRYDYIGLKANDRYHKRGREYRLYLPLYREVEWMEIGVSATSYVEALPIRNEKPIVVYGTSIAQGSCASRPGMAWTAIVGRKMDRPVINLGFGGNGTLDRAVIDLIVETDAKVFILDCLPNLIREVWKDQEIKARVRAAVKTLHDQKPDVPILLVDHAGFTEGSLVPNREKAFQRVNRVQQEAFQELKQEGIKSLYYLSKDEIDLPQDGTVDGTHPTDLGMMHYAESYERKLRSILHEPIGKLSTTRPITQYREPDNYDWEHRHREILEINATDPPKQVIIANSIIHFWGGIPRTKLVREEGTWKNVFTPLGVRNYAYGWDRLENVLWRIYHGELDGFEAERVLVMIGTNNLHLNTDEEIIEGLELVMKAIRQRQPRAEIVLMGILPRRDYELRLLGLNKQIAGLAAKLGFTYGDVGAFFLTEQGTIQESLFSDGLHPNADGYLKLREGLRPFLNH